MPTKPQHDAIYVRVSSRKQDQASQLPDLKRWAKGQDGPIVWYDDKKTGKTMDRPGWRKLEAAIAKGLVKRIVVWRLDRLGRTARELTPLFHELTGQGIDIIFLREGIDLGTPAGKLMSTIIAGVAEYETELRGERIRAGIEVARERGTRSGRPFGRPKGSGRPLKVTQGKRATIRTLKAEGKSVSAIARVVELDRKTVYAVLKATVASQLPS